MFQIDTSISCNDFVHFHFILKASPVGSEFMGHFCPGIIWTKNPNIVVSVEIQNFSFSSSFYAAAWKPDLNISRSSNRNSFVINTKMFSIGFHCQEIIFPPFLKCHLTLLSSKKYWRAWPFVDSISSISFFFCCRIDKCFFQHFKNGLKEIVWPRSAQLYSSLSLRNRNFPVEFISIAVWHNWVLSSLCQKLYRIIN